MKKGKRKENAFSIIVYIIIAAIFVATIIGVVVNVVGNKDDANNVPATSIPVMTEKASATEDTSSVSGDAVSADEEEQKDKKDVANLEKKDSKENDNSNDSKNSGKPSTKNRNKSKGKSKKQPVATRDTNSNDDKPLSEREATGEENVIDFSELQ